MFVRAMMLAIVVAVFSAAPALLSPVQAAEPGEAKAESFKYISKSVSTLQRKLLKAGYKVGDVDGIFGPHTSRAIIQYQKDHGLPQTGYPDAGFLDHLNKNKSSKP